MQLRPRCDCGGLKILSCGCICSWRLQSKTILLVMFKDLERLGWKKMYIWTRIQNKNSVFEFWRILLCKRQRIIRSERPWWQFYIWYQENVCNLMLVFLGIDWLLFFYFIFYDCCFFIPFRNETKSDHSIFNQKTN